MDKVLVDGTTYVKSSLLAKKFRYTSDYLGQLCRSGKVDCQLVGRSWYINEDSLLAHKDSRYKEMRIDEKTLENSNFHNSTDSNLAVRPRLSKTTIKSVQTHFSSNRSNHIHINSKYFSDDSDLLPQPLRKISPQIPVVEEVSISSDNISKTPVSKPKILKVADSADNKVSLSFTDIPEVALSGTLAVKDAALPENDVFTPISESDVKGLFVKKFENETTTPSTHSTQATNVTHARKASHFTPMSVVSESKQKLPVWLFVSSLISSLCLSLFLLLAVQLYVVDAFSVHASVVVQIDHFFEVWNLLLK